MSLHFGSTANCGPGKKRFSIDDAFEEETDEAIRVYGSADPHQNTPSATTPEGPPPPPPPAAAATTTITSNTNGINGEPLDNRSSYKVVHEAGSRDSDSLIQDCYYEGSVSGSELGGSARSCFRHPKVRENWRMVLAASTLLLVGVGLLATGVLALAEPHSGLQGAVFFVAGFICFVPGAYHVVYIYLAANGRRGYHFHNLPLFT